MKSQKGSLIPGIRTEDVVHRLQISVRLTQKVGDPVRGNFEGLISLICDWISLVEIPNVEHSVQCGPLKKWVEIPIYVKSLRNKAEKPQSHTLVGHV